MGSTVKSMPKSALALLGLACLIQIASGEPGGGSGSGSGGAAHPQDSCGWHGWGAHQDGQIKCSDLEHPGYSPYPEGSDKLLSQGDGVLECCMGGGSPGATASCESMYQNYKTSCGCSATPITGDPAGAWADPNAGAGAPGPMPVCEDPATDCDCDNVEEPDPVGDHQAVTGYCSLLQGTYLTGDYNCDHDPMVGNTRIMDEDTCTNEMVEDAGTGIPAGTVLTQTQAMHCAWTPPETPRIATGEWRAHNTSVGADAHEPGMHGSVLGPWSHTSDDDDDDVWCNEDGETKQCWTSRDNFICAAAEGDCNTKGRYYAGFNTACKGCQEISDRCQVKASTNSRRLLSTGTSEPTTAAAAGCHGINWDSAKTGCACPDTPEEAGDMPECHGAAADPATNGYCEQIKTDYRAESCCSSHAPFVPPEAQAAGAARTRSVKWIDPPDFMPTDWCPFKPGPSSKWTEYGLMPALVELGYGTSCNQMTTAGMTPLTVRAECQLKQCEAVKENKDLGLSGAVNKVIGDQPYHTFERCTDTLQAVPSSWVQPQQAAQPAVQPQDLCNPIDLDGIDADERAEFVNDTTLEGKLRTQMVWAAGATVGLASNIEVWGAEAGRAARTCAQYADFLGYVHDYGAIRHAREECCAEVYPRCAPGQDPDLDPAGTGPCCPKADADCQCTKYMTDHGLCPGDGYDAMGADSVRVEGGCWNTNGIHAENAGQILSGATNLDISTCNYPFIPMDQDVTSLAARRSEGGFQEGYSEGSCGWHGWGAHQDGPTKCTEDATAGYTAYPEDSEELHETGNSVLTCCMGGGSANPNPNPSTDKGMYAYSVPEFGMAWFTELPQDMGGGNYALPMRHVVIDLNLQPQPTSEDTCADVLAWAWANDFPNTTFTPATNCTFHLIPADETADETTEPRLPDNNDMFDSCRHECPSTATERGFDSVKGKGDWYPPGYQSDRWTGTCILPYTGGADPAGSVDPAAAAGEAAGDMP